MSGTIQLTDELLELALARRMAYRVPSGLVERAIERLDDTDLRRGVPTRGLEGPPLRLGARKFFAPALGGALMVVVAMALTILALRQTSGPAASSQGPSPVATPVRVLLGTAVGNRLSLGSGTVPMDVISAFGSIWVADRGSNDVRRFDPLTMALQSRVETFAPSWFAVSTEAIWVTNGRAPGLSRIDPITNTVLAEVGDWAPCGAPVIRADGIWVSACDVDEFLRIDPVNNGVVARIPANGHRLLFLVNGDLITQSSDGHFDRLDPAGGTFTRVATGLVVTDGAVTSDGSTLWVAESSGTSRVDPADGRVLSTFPYRSVASITFSNGHAWITDFGPGLAEIDLTTNVVLRTIPIGPSGQVAREVGGKVWLTDANNGNLWRIEP